MMNQSLHDLIALVYQEFTTLNYSCSIVKPSCPILYFGDYEAFNSSKTRIITVANNPSNIEFAKATTTERKLAKEDEFFRFPAVRQQNFFQAYNEYFKKYPYNKWFRGTFEPFLNGMDASYYPNHNTNTALHTDLLTPFATSPTWSKISSASQECLEPFGKKVWHSLVECLQPDVIILSVAKAHLADIAFLPSTNHWNMIAENSTTGKTGKQRKYSLQSREVSLQSGKVCTIIVNTASRVPLYSFSDEQKRTAGKTFITSKLPMK